MPFTDTFMTPGLLFPEGGSREGPWGPPAPSQEAQGRRGGLTCPLSASSAAKAQDPIHCPHFPQEHC